MATRKPRNTFTSSGSSPRPSIWGPGSSPFVGAPAPAPVGPSHPWGGTVGGDLSTQPSVQQGPWGPYAAGTGGPPIGQTPPPGSYDPVLQQNLVGAGVGLVDMLGGNIDPATGHYVPPPTNASGGYQYGPQSQIGLALSRGQEDYGTGLNALNTGYNQQLEDIGTTLTRGTQDINRAYQYGTQDIGNTQQDLRTALSRNTQDIGTTFDRGNEDINRQLASLQRQYQNLGSRQTQQAAAQGVGEGGATRQSQMKRAANEAFDQQPIDTSRQRLGEDYGSGGRYMTRAQEDYGTGMQRTSQAQQRLTAEYGPGGYELSRLQEDYGPQGRYADQAQINYSQGLGSLNTNWNRTQQDLGISAAQAIRDYGLFGANTAQSQWFQAGQTLSPSALQSALGVGPDPRFAPRPRRRY